MRPGQYLTRSLVYFDNRGRRRRRQRLRRAGRRHVGPRSPALQTGFVRSYALSMFVGAAVLVGALLLVRSDDDDFPWLEPRSRSCPLVGAVVVAALPRGPASCWPSRSRSASRWSRFVLTVADGAQFDTARPRSSSSPRAPVDPAVRRAATRVGVDGIALVLVALSDDPRAARDPRRRWNDADDAARRSVKAYFALILVLEAMMVGVFAATDVFLFYVFFEAMLIPVYFLIGSLRRAAALVRRGEVPAVQPVRRPADAGRADRRCTSCPRPAGTGTFDFASAASACDIDPTTQKWLFLGFFIAFAIKAPLWPFHTWLPDAAAEATPGTAVLLVGVLDKVGTFGMLRLCLPAVPGRVAVVHAGGHRARGRSASSTARCWRSARPTSSG